MTLGLVLLLTSVFTAEVKLGFGTGSTIDQDTLLAFGGTSWATVVDHGEVWRVPLASLLHASLEHLLSNTVSLASIGLLLEPLVGHGWFAAIFCLGALGATAASIAANPAALVGVGASGGLMALIAATFVLSWHHRAADDAPKMFRRGLFFGVPALLPMLLPLPHHAGVQVDYAAHLSGAVVGSLLAVALQTIWPDEDRRPRGGAAGAVAAAWLLAVAVSACFVVAHRAGAAASAAEHHAQATALTDRFIPAGQVPHTLADAAPMVATFLRLYPLDPRSHLLQGSLWQQKHDFVDAERELRIAADLIDRDDAHLFDPIRPALMTALALVQQQLGRPMDARETARSPCHGQDAALKRSLVVAGLCS